MIGKSKKATFQFIKDHVWSKINSWSSRCLSQAGREILIKSVLNLKKKLIFFQIKFFKKKNLKLRFSKKIQII